MLLALPKFQFRFMPGLGNIVYPGNFHPVGVRAATEGMLDRVAAGEGSAGQNWIVVGGSGGFGSAARIVLGKGRGAATLNVSLDAQPTPQSNNKIRKIGSPGYHRNRAIEAVLGEGARSLNGDAFDPTVRDEAIELIRAHYGGKVHGLVWALAAPRATDSRTGKAVTSVLKPVGNPVTVKTFTGAPSTVAETEIAPGTPEEAIATIFVMGGGVVRRWINALLAADVLADGFTLLTISYRGNPLNEGVYRKGLIGLAKADLEFETAALSKVLAARVGGRAIAVEGPAVVTEASGGIPGVPFYLANVIDVMGDRFEDPVACMTRMFADLESPPLDEEGLWRLDDRELTDEVQTELARRYDAAVVGDPFDERLYNLFMSAYAQTRGFDIDGVDYEAEFDTDRL